MQRIGLIGLGIMGTAMANNWLKAGFPLTVYNRDPSKCAPLVEKGAALAKTPAQLARETDIVVLMVTGPEACDALLWDDKQGAASELDPGQIVVNMSTVSPHYAVEMYNCLREVDAFAVDAPVSGSKKPAEDGTLVILAGGDQPIVEKLAPVFAAVGKHTVYCGEAGKGALMKMAVNLLLGGMMEAYVEMLNYGQHAGLELDAMQEVVRSGPLNNVLFQLKESMFAEEKFPPQFPMKHMAKDLKFVLDTAHRTGAPAPLANLVYQLYAEGTAKGMGDEDFAAVFRVLQQRNGA